MTIHVQTAQCWVLRSVLASGQRAVYPRTFCQATLTDTTYEAFIVTSLDALDRVLIEVYHDDIGRWHIETKEFLEWPAAHTQLCGRT